MPALHSEFFVRAASAALAAASVVALGAVTPPADRANPRDSMSRGPLAPQERNRPAGSERLWSEVEGLRAEAVEALLRAGQPPDPRRGLPPGDTPLLYVTRQGCPTRAPESKAAAAATALALIRYKADVNAVGEDGLTPLLHAAYACPPGVVVALMQAGADTRARTRGDASALALAIVDDRADNVRAMLDAGYDVARERKELTTYLSGKPEILAIVDGVLARSAPPEPAVHWQDIDVRARLDGSGVLHATEHVWLTVVGDRAVVERSFRGGMAIDVRVSRVARLEASGGEPRALALGPLDIADHYEFVDGRDLRWSLRGAGDPAVGTATALLYRIEYTISGTVIPVWGVRPFGAATILSPFMLYPLRRMEELWQAWRLAPGAWGSRYVMDHDFSPFPYLGGKPIGCVTLEMTVDPAWGVRKALRREWLRVAAEDEVREFIPLDFRGTGVPAAVDRAQQAAWLAPLPVLFLASVGLWVALFLGRWRQRRRFDQTPVDEDWIRLHVLTRPPDEIARLLDPNCEKVCPGAPAILEEMARQGKIEFDEQIGGGTLRMRSSRDALTPWERAIVERLFGDADVVDRETVRRRLPGGARDLEGPARRAFEVEAERVNRWRPSPRAVPTLVLVSLGFWLMLSELAAGGFQALAVSLVVGSVMYGNLHAAAKRWGGSPELPLLPIAVLLLPPLAFSAVAFVFFVTVPAYPRVIVGLAALGIGLANSLFNAARPLLGEPERELRYGLTRARSYIRSELQKPHPNLEDSWLSWILALGLGDEAAGRRHQEPPDASLPPDPAACAAMGRWNGGTTSASEAAWADKFLGRPDA
jgi:hypothetical protein